MVRMANSFWSSGYRSAPDVALYEELHFGYALGPIWFAEMDTGTSVPRVRQYNGLRFGVLDGLFDGFRAGVRGISPLQPSTPPSRRLRQLARSRPLNLWSYRVAYSAAHVMGFQDARLVLDDPEAVRAAPLLSANPAGMASVLVNRLRSLYIDERSLATETTYALQRKEELFQLARDILGWPPGAKTSS